MINSPKLGFVCPMPWTQMSGTERVRFCSACQMQVPNLSLLSVDEREAILRRAESEKVCGSFLVRLSGELVSPENPLTHKEQLGIKQLGVAALSAGVLAVAAGCVSPKQAVLPQSPTEPVAASSTPAPATSGSKAEEETIVLFVGLITCDKPAPVRPKLPNGKW